MAITDGEEGVGFQLLMKQGKTRWQGRVLKSDEGKGSRQKGRELDWGFSWGHKVGGWGLSGEGGCYKHLYVIPRETRQTAKEVREQETSAELGTSRKCAREQGQE